MKNLTPMAAVFLGASSIAMAQTTDEPLWLDDLRHQLNQDEQCEVLYFINVKVGELGGKMTQEARAQCADSRQFDGLRILPEFEFKLSRCDIQAC